MSSAVDERSIEQAYEYLEGLRGKIPDADLEEMQRRMLSSPDEVRQETRQELEEEQEYDLDPVDHVPPAFYFKSDKVLKLGRGGHIREINIRFLGIDDYIQLSEQAPDAWQYMVKRGNKSLQDAGFGGFVQEMLSRTAKEQKDAKSRFVNKFLELLAFCLNTPNEEPVVDVSFLKACGMGQWAKAIQALWEVNREDFLDVWAVMPGPIRELGASVIGKIMKLIRQIESLDLTLTQLLNGIGGMLNGGSTNLLTQLQANMAGQQQTSASSVLSTPGDTNSPPSTANKQKVT